MRRGLTRPASGVRLGVPAYEYPGGELWRHLQDLPPTSLVIIDPADGPGEAVDPNYVAAISAVRAPEIALYGYVTTDYGRRSADEMIREIADYRRWYQPTGIFLDQTPAASTSNREIVATMEHVRTEQLALAINPGQPDIAPEDVRRTDHVVNFEGALSAYQRAIFPTWTTEFPAERFWHLVYEVGDPSSLRGVFTRAARCHAGVVFVTDATMPNPWGRLPSYWREELRLSRRSRVRL